jgi:hypothetical protein
MDRFVPRDDTRAVIASEAWQSRKLGSESNFYLLQILKIKLVSDPDFSGATGLTKNGPKAVFLGGITTSLLAAF